LCGWNKIGCNSAGANSDVVSDLRVDNDASGALDVDDDDDVNDADDDDAPDERDSAFTAFGTAFAAGADCNHS
jgi:hypothetical protein